MKQIFTYVGYIATLLGLIWTVIKMYNFYVKPKQKLGYSCKDCNIVDSNSSLLYKLPCELGYKYELKLHTIFNNNEQNNEEIKEIEDIYAINLEIKNIGNKIIKGEDFYQNDKLGFAINYRFLCASVLDKTLEYINPKLKINKDYVDIEFDSLKPKDSIYLSILFSSEPYSYSNFIKGKTEEIDKIPPIDSYTSKHFSAEFSRDWMYVKEGFKTLYKATFIQMFVYMILSSALILIIICLLSKIL